MTNTTTPASGLLTAAAILILVVLSGYLLIVGQPVFVPLVLAVFIAYLITALGHALQRISIGGRRLPGGIALACAIALFILLIAILVQLVAGNVRAVVDAAPQYQARLEDVLVKANIYLSTLFNQKEPITIASLVNQVNLRALVERLANALQSIAGNTLQICIYVAFLLLERRIFDRKITAMFPNTGREQAIRATLEEIGSKIEAYVLIKTSMSFMTGLFSYAVLAVIGVDFAPFWALLIFILNFIPYIGAIIGVMFPALLALLQFGSPVQPLIIVAVLTGVQALFDNLIEPRLAGKTLNLSPIMIIIGLSVWGAIWGITGMILSVPIMVITMIVLAQFPRSRPVAILMSETGDIR